MAYGYLKTIGMHLANWGKILSFSGSHSNALPNKQAFSAEPVIPVPPARDNHCEIVGQDQIKISPEDSLFAPSRYLLGLIQVTMREGIVRKYAWQGCADIIVIPDKKLYYSSAELQDLKPFFEAPARNIKVSLLDINKLDNIIDQLIAKSRPIDDLLWCAAQYGSKGRLLKSADPDTPVRLKYWPDIAHLPDYRQYLPLAAFLNSNATDISTIAEQTQTALGVVNNFYNACVTLDLLETASEIILQDKQDNTLDHALYENISKTLSGECVASSQTK